MKTIMTFMGEDHNRLDTLFQKYHQYKTTEFQKAKLLFQEFSAGLQRHIVWEEDVLFPIFEDKQDMHLAGPTVVMRAEHDKIKACLKQIHGKLQAGDVDTQVIEDNLIAVLTEHNEKEEQILYPWIDQTLNEEERTDVFHRLDEI